MPWDTTHIKSQRSPQNLLKLINSLMRNYNSPRFKLKRKRKRESGMRTLTTLAPSWARLVSRTQINFLPNFIASLALTKYSTWQHSPRSIEALLRLLQNTMREKKLLTRFSLRSHQKKTPRTSTPSSTTSHSSRPMSSLRSTGRWITTTNWASLRLQTWFEAKSR